MDLNFVFVTYRYDSGLLRNLHATRNVFPDSCIIVVDNDSYCNNELLLKLDGYNVEYIRNTTNSRFVAYNLALPLLVHQNTCFRTDDDLFNEHELYTVLRHAFSDLIMTPYLYNGELQNHKMAHRPIESMVFKTAVLHELGEFATNTSADWQLLVRAFKTYSVEYRDQIILTKAIHGRPE